MAFCKKCGAELVEGGKFCKRCGAPVESAPARQKPVERKEVKEEKPKKKKSSIKTILTTALITILTGLVIGFCSTMSGDGAGSISKIFTGKDTPAEQDYNSMPTGITNDEMELNGIKPSPYGEYPGPKDLYKAIHQPILDTEGIPGIVDIDDLSDEELESSDDSLFEGNMKKWKSSYAGTWTSVGMYVMEYNDIMGLTNAEVAATIDQHMSQNEKVKFVFDNTRRGEAEIWMNGKLLTKGRHNVFQYGNMSIDADNGQTWMWMYSPFNGVLFSYIYYIEDDGTEMATGLKFNRVTK